MCGWALAGYEKALGPDHTSALSTVHNLGLLYGDQSKLAEAEQMYARSLASPEVVEMLAMPTNPLLVLLCSWQTGYHLSDLTSAKLSRSTATLPARLSGTSGPGLFFCRCRRWSTTPRSHH